MALPAIGALLGIGKAVGAGMTFVESTTPKLEDEVVVEVLGQPGASKKTLYFLALTAAYGLARPGALGRFFTPPPSLLMIEYDAADDWVRVTLKYRVGALDFVNQNLGNSALLGPLGAVAGIIQSVGAVTLAGDLPILNGPKSSLDGVTPVIPMSFLNIPLPTTGVTTLAANPFIGSRILTNDAFVTSNGQSIPTPNPKPSGDSRSRGSVDPTMYAGGITEKFLVPLVFAALSAPGSQNDLTFTPPQQGNTGGG